MPLATHQMTPNPEPLRTTAQRLDLGIQLAWDKANTELLNGSPNKDELIALIAALRHCAARAKAIGFVTGETELLRMARYLEAHIS
jgi:hypothetical protein